MRHATNLSYSIGQPISVLSHDPDTLPPLTTYLQQGLLRGGPNAELRSVSITDVDLPMRTFKKNSIRVLNKTLTSQGSLGRVASDFSSPLPKFALSCLVKFKVTVCNRRHISTKLQCTGEKGAVDTAVSSPHPN